MRVLGIESSCDETGIAVYDSDCGIRSQNVYSQVELHKRYGGVVPELASRDHIRKIGPLVDQTLEEAALQKSELDGIAYTSGPGLIGSLMVGAAFGRSFAWSLNLPALGIHHMEAHLLAPLMAEPKPNIPFVALLVSGGHTMLVYVSAIGHYELLGQSVDDAAGEAFDKVAKMLELGYPGGPAVSRAAQSGDRERFRFPRPMTDRPGLDFSFSGLKTAVRNVVLAEQPLSDSDVADISASFEMAVAETLYLKCRRALEECGVRTLVVSGGVAANSTIRREFTELDANVAYPPIELCTDNGAMIAFAGYQRLNAGFREGLSIDTQARWDIQSLERI